MRNWSACSRRSRHHRQGGRDTHYGHKLNLATGRSGLILDVVIEAGNPADSARFMRCWSAMLRTITHRAKTSADAAMQHRQFERAKALGVEDVAFHKKCRSRSRTWSRADGCTASCELPRRIEATSCLKRAFGCGVVLGGLAHFHSYVWASVVAYNLTLFTTLVQPEAKKTSSAPLAPPANAPLCLTIYTATPLHPVAAKNPLIPSSLR